LAGAMAAAQTVVAAEQEAQAAAMEEEVAYKRTLPPALDKVSEGHHLGFDEMLSG
jgi:hypothetical protein